METLPQPPTPPPLLALSPSPRSHLISLEIPVNAGYLHSNSSPPHQLHNATSEIQNSTSLTFKTQVYNRGAVRPCGKIPTFSRFFLLVLIASLTSLILSKDIMKFADLHHVWISLNLLRSDKYFKLYHPLSLEVIQMQGQTGTERERQGQTG